METDEERKKEQDSKKRSLKGRKWAKNRRYGKKSE